MEVIISKKMAKLNMGFYISKSLHRVGIILAMTVANATWQL